MSERGKARYSYVSAGSNSTIKSGAGTLYGILVSPANGATVYAVDADGTDPLGGIGAAPNLTGELALASNIARHGVFANTAPDYLDFNPGVGFNNGLVVAATSNARLTVVYE